MVTIVWQRVLQEVILTLAESQTTRADVQRIRRRSREMNHFVVVGLPKKAGIRIGP
jgi:hypothetical protein